MKTVYIELIFGLNFIMNLYLIRLTAVLLKKTTTWVRVLAGSFTGAVLYCLSISMQGRISVPAMAVMISTSVLVCRLVFQSRRITELLRQTGYLYVSGCFLGGSLLFLRKRIPGLDEMKESCFLILLAGAVVYELARMMLGKLREKDKKLIYTVTLQGDHEELHVPALLDTGNGLVEPVTGKGVSVLEESVFRKMTAVMRPEKLKVIPYHSIGTEHGMMKGYEIDRMKIGNGEEEQVVCKVIVAVYEGKLSGNDSYRMILSPKVLEEPSYP